MYRSIKRHDRLFTEVGQKMWNFTGRAVITPDLSAVQDLMTCPETATQQQIDVTSLTPEDWF